MKKNSKLTCVDCAMKSCDGKSSDKWPEFCLTTNNGDEETLAAALKCYDESENSSIMINAARVEYEYYGKMTRVEETVAFAKKMGYTKIGIATCVGLLNESRILANILRGEGFEVFGIACKAGAVDKTAVGIDEECTRVGAKMCNPINQAMRLNKENTQMNIIMGLCVGHDMLFTKYSSAPVTTLVAKDRVTGHNPAAALYTSGSYYSRLLKSDDKK